jgi:NADH-quinone oxidoreductase subunit M
VFFGQPTEALQRVTKAHPPADLDWVERLPALILLVALLFFGFYPKALSQPVDQALNPTHALFRPTHFHR